MAVTDGKPRGVPLTGPSFHGTFDQRCAIERWERAGWTFLHWTEVPQIMAVLESLLNEIVFIDEYGWAWKGPAFSRSTPVPFDRYPPRGAEELIET